MQLQHTSALSVFLFDFVLPHLTFSSLSSSVLSSPHVVYLFAVTHAYGLSSCYVVFLCFCLFASYYFFSPSSTFFHACFLWPPSLPYLLGFFRLCLLQSIFPPRTGPFFCHDPFPPPGCIMIAFQICCHKKLAFVLFPPAAYEVVFWIVFGSTAVLELN